MKKYYEFIKKIFFLFLIIYLTSCSLFAPKFIINFEQIADLQKDSPVILDSVKVGEVFEIKQHKNKYQVKIRIFYKFRKSLKENSEFFINRSTKETGILIKNDTLNNKILSSKLAIDGSGFYERRIKILFDNIGDIIEHRPVNLMNQKNNEEGIGEVYDITKKHDKFQVHIRIFHKFNSAIKKRAKFYIVGKGNSSRVVILNINTSLPVLESKMVYGKTQTEFWFDKIKDKIKQMF